MTKEFMTTKPVLQRSLEKIHNVIAQRRQISLEGNLRRWTWGSWDEKMIFCWPSVPWTVCNISLQPENKSLLLGRGKWIERGWPTCLRLYLKLPIYWRLRLSHIIGFVSLLSHTVGFASWVFWIRMSLIDSILGQLMPSWWRCWGRFK